MFRIAEFSEGSSKLRGKNFTPDLFLERWTDKNGEMNRFGKGQTYFAFWDGYNVPLQAMWDFQNSFGGDAMSKREKRLFVQIMDRNPEGYLIAYVKGDKKVLRHEVAHSKFFEYPKYAREAGTIVSSLSRKTLQKYHRHLRAMNYSPDTYTDEIQAYLAAYDSKEHQECFKSIKKEEIKKQVWAMKRLFEQYH